LLTICGFHPIVAMSFFSDHMLRSASSGYTISASKLLLPALISIHRHVDQFFDFP
jgi:hypothetical protein